MNPQDDISFVSIFQPRDGVQADMIRSTLESEDINVYVNNEAASRLRFGGAGIGAGTMAVMVPETQAEDALQIIESLGFR